MERQLACKLNFQAQREQVREQPLSISTSLRCVSKYPYATKERFVLEAIKIYNQLVIFIEK